MDRLKMWLAGRYGADHLARFLTVAALILFVLALPLDLRLLNWAGWALLAWAVFRFLSQNAAARARENAVYLKYREKVLRWVKLQRCRWRDRKTHVYCDCPKCCKTLRLPKKQGRLIATCPCCGWQFERRT